MVIINGNNISIKDTDTGCRDDLGKQRNFEGEALKLAFLENDGEAFELAFHVWVSRLLNSIRRTRKNSEQISNGTNALFFSQQKM